ncbi:ephrin-B2-like, partial [Myzus persicae]|uniref:ephrin-B2-like n=1 Tax=Myzus persicae TaxID=13164 RepID=UPI000B930228
MVLFDNLFGFPGLPGCLRFFSPPSAAAGRRPTSATMRGVSCTKITSCLTLVLLICFETVLLSTVSDCTKSFTVHWNTSNSIFRIDNTDHIIDVNKGNQPFEYDQVNIVCPVYAPGTHESDAEKYIIYNVSKEEYDMCRITNPNPRIIAYCDKPYKLMYVTITFRSFTPQPGGLEFQPGQDYYFICEYKLL